jgi:hypothetical protein
MLLSSQRSAGIGTNRIAEAQAETQQGGIRRPRIVVAQQRIVAVFSHTRAHIALQYRVSVTVGLNSDSFPSKLLTASLRHLWNIELRSSWCEGDVTFVLTQASAHFARCHIGLNLDTRLCVELAVVVAQDNCVVP